MADSHNENYHHIETLNLCDTKDINFMIYLNALNCRWHSNEEELKQKLNLR